MLDSEILNFNELFHKIDKNSLIPISTFDIFVLKLIFDQLKEYHTSKIIISDGDVRSKLDIPVDSDNANEIHEEIDNALAKFLNVSNTKIVTDDTGSSYLSHRNYFLKMLLSYEDFEIKIEKADFWTVS